MAPKRKIAPLGLERRVRPRKEEDWDEVESQASSSDDEVEEQGARGEDESDDSEQESEIEQEKSGDDSESDDEPPQPKVDLTSISFGALAKAQESLPSRKQKSSKNVKSPTEADTPISRRPSKPTKEDLAKLKRSSKHAPQEQTSTRPVSRRREVVSGINPRGQYRDPRFDPLVSRLDEAKAQKAYAFLDEYREKEMADLRAQIKKTKNPDVKEKLKRELMSMESRKKARLRKEKEEELLKEHRKKEKDLVAQGKQPFYLKKSEQKKQLLVNRFESMSKGQVDRAIERKRKKVAGKEKKELDSLQRFRPRD